MVLRKNGSPPHAREMKTNVSKTRKFNTTGRKKKKLIGIFLPENRAEPNKQEATRKKKKKEKIRLGFWIGIF